MFLANKQVLKYSFNHTIYSRELRYVYI